MPDGTLEEAAQIDRDVDCQRFAVDQRGSFFIGADDGGGPILCKYDASGNCKFTVDDISSSDPGAWIDERIMPDANGGVICFSTSTVSSADMIIPPHTVIRRIDSTGGDRVDPRIPIAQRAI
jgi:hypothetical protein